MNGKFQFMTTLLENQHETTIRFAKSGDMQAAILYGKEDVRVERTRIPEVGKGEVRVSIQAALTCGTDVKVYRRGYHAAMLKPPIRFGHEFAGIIEAVGEGVKAWEVGQRVVSANSAPCDDCFYCKKGHPELCEDLLFLNGAYAEKIVIPARIVEKNLLSIPVSLSFAEAAMTEPLACVVRGMQEVPVQSGETVIILGAGPIGLMFVRLCKLAGAKVIATGRRRDRLALAEKLGADEVYDVSSAHDLTTTLKARTDGARGADVVIEAVGKPEAWEQAISLARKAGTVNLFGGCPANTAVSVDTHRVHYHELTLKGAFHHTPQTIRTALNLIASGQVPAGEFIQEAASLEDLPQILANLAAGRGPIKAAILPS